MKKFTIILTACTLMYLISTIISHSIGDSDFNFSWLFGWFSCLIYMWLDKKIK